MTTDDSKLRTLRGVLDASLTTALKGFEDVDLPAGAELAAARKLGVYLPVTCCVLTDSTGENHCKYPLPEMKPRPRTWRLYDWWWDTRERLGRQVAGWRWPGDDE